LSVVGLALALGGCAMVPVDDGYYYSAYGPYAIGPYGERYVTADGVVVVYDRSPGVYRVSSYPGLYRWNHYYYRERDGRWQRSRHRNGPWVYRPTAGVPFASRVHRNEHHNYRTRDTDWWAYRTADSLRRDHWRHDDRRNSGHDEHRNEIIRRMTVERRGIPPDQTVTARADRDGIAGSVSSGTGRKPLPSLQLTAPKVARRLARPGPIEWADERKPGFHSIVRNHRGSMRTGRANRDPGPSIIH
jgi:hypothetical protein